ncbi:hypothetical protein GALMADRAFT_152142 [Galerina marginata CBS 339.88]|uniref:Uncharacterized protein n=1 Tax=Galerina marginata (strain CBS 339.88) TaxID=685588 RepID=A0A067TIZ5_GALM3|nr:hypothetical protein GALMADRAFT_152142 [Galerina marginata CBS 339.88]
MYKLNRDLYLEIFMMNAKLDECSVQATIFTVALQATVRSSHVCRQWRELILDSPSLWGRLINFDELLELNTKWRDEIFRRTGNASLDVRFGTSDPKLSHRHGLSHFCLSRRLSSGAGYVILTFLEKEWWRTRYLDMTIPSSFFSCIPGISNEDAQGTLRKLWNVFENPTAQLEHFCIRPVHHRVDPPLLLFSNNAPALRDFRSHTLNFHSPAPWMRNLTRIAIKGIDPQDTYFTTKRILDALAQTPLLESLSFIWNIRQPSLTNKPTLKYVHLPNLRSIELGAVTQSHTELLGHITPRTNHLLSLNLYIYVYPLLQEDSALAVEVLSRYGQYFFASHNGLWFSLTIVISNFGLRALTTWKEYSPDLYIRTHSMWDYPDPPLLSSRPLPLFLSVFASTIFSKITHLELNMTQSDNSYYLTFLPLFTSVSTLRTPANTMIFLASAQYNNPLAFPALHTLGVEGMYGLQGIDSSDHHGHPLLRFFAFRSASGRPIEVLDFTIVSTLPVQLDLRYLDSIFGLKIIWRNSDAVMEYTCGSGRPESLLLVST